MDHADKTKLVKILRANGLDDVLLELELHAMSRIGRVGASDSETLVYALLCETRTRYKAIINTESILEAGRPYFDE
jgi:hypothetical protein